MYTTTVDCLPHAIPVRTTTYYTVLKELNPTVPTDTVPVPDNAIPSHTIPYGNYTAHPHIIPTRTGTVTAIVTAMNPIPTQNIFSVQSHSEQSSDLVVMYHSHRKFPGKYNTRQLPSREKYPKFLQIKTIYLTISQKVHTSFGNSP
jgi:hypothetical protein